MTTSWSLADIPFDRIDKARACDRDDLFLLVTAASFVEIASDLYTANLVHHYASDREITDWLAQVWEHEEVQHGKALREYVRFVWPQFDWETAFTAFLKEYRTLCDVDHFEPTPGLEMVARCVIEMGTAGFYRALGSAANEPVLQVLTDYIQADEVGHYKYFLRFFQRYNKLEKHSRWRILRALTHRLFEVRGDDADCALWHAFHARHPQYSRESREFRTAFTQAAHAVRAHFPSSMAVKMLTKPLNLPTFIARLIETPLAAVAQRLILR